MGHKTMGMSDLPTTSVIALVERQKRGEISAVDITKAYIAQVEAKESNVRAFAWFDAAYALAQAEQLDSYRKRGLPIGPLHGVPVALKDIIDTKAIPTENGTPIDSGRVPNEDATIVSKLRSAGAIIFAKTTTTPLAYLTPCETRNPHNIEHTPGGSSAGSAAAVAAGMVPIAVGTQTGGSVIRPASFCGVHAIKPSFGLISRKGVLMQSPTLDTVGVFATCVEDLGIVVDVLAGYDERDPSTHPIPSPDCARLALQNAPVKPNFAIIVPPGHERASEEMNAAIDELAEFLDSQAVKTELPWTFEEAIVARERINLAEMAKCYYRYVDKHKDNLPESVSKAIDKGEQILARDYISALDWRELLNTGLERIFERYDALILPSSPGAAPGLETTGDAIFNGIWTLCGTPAINLPIFTSETGLPMGIQLVGARGQDGRLLRTARWLRDALLNAQKEEVA